MKHLGELVGGLLVGAGGIYFYKRSKGAAPPVVAPAVPVPTPVVNQPPAALQPPGLGTQALAALTGGNTTTMSQGQAQSAIDAANAAGGFASSDLGQAAGAAGGNSTDAALQSALAGLDG